MKPINKKLRKYRKAETLTEFSDNELIELTRHFIDHGNFEDSKDTTRELQNRYPYSKVRDLLANANNELNELYLNLYKIEKEKNSLTCEEK